MNDGRTRSRCASRWQPLRAVLHTLLPVLIVLSAPLPVPATPLGDGDCDGSVLIAAVFGEPTLGCAADVNADGAVDAADAVALMQILGAPVPTPPGPAVTFFGLAGADGGSVVPLGALAGIPVFARPAGSGFKVIVEGGRGSDGLTPGTATFNSNPRDPAARPDLQIESTSALGDGSATVCDGEGVPGLDPPDFGPSQTVANTLNDLGCNFTQVISSPAFACTHDQFGTTNFLGVGSQLQFCLQVARVLAFPPGDTVLTVQLRDLGGQLGPRQQIIVRIGTGSATFTPTPIPPTVTPTRSPPPPSNTASPTRSVTPTVTLPLPSATASATRTATLPAPSRTPTGSATVLASATATTRATSTPTTRATLSPTPRPTLSPTRSSSPSGATPTPSRTHTPAPTRTPTRTPSATATPRPAPSATPTGAIGPSVTFVGMTHADESLIDPSGTTPEGLLIFRRSPGLGFNLVVEGKPGPSGIPIADAGHPALTYVPGAFPSLQIEVSRPLGNGSPAVCDASGSTAGGVPAVTPPDFAPTQTNINSVNDLSCRFLDGAGAMRGRTASVDSCVVPATGLPQFANTASTVQFCGQINGYLAFPPGDTVVTVRLSDENGNPGAPAQFVVAVATPTPTATVPQP